jgi:oligopeptide transport system substrate-binding protein
MLKFSLLLSVVVLIASVGCTKKVDLDEKVLNLTVTAKVKGFDPVDAGDTYSSGEIARIYEGLLTYHYLKRPYELIPHLAEAMPEVSADGKTYTFKIKKGIKFHDNKCFPGGKGRELKAEDFVFSVKRMADAKNVSTGWWLLDGKIKGLNEWRDKYASADKVNYDEVVEGVKSLDDHTLQFVLKDEYPQFLYALAMSYTYAVPREAVEFYGKDFINNPVGTGPFITGTYTQANRIEYVRNPNYHDVFYPTEGSEGDKEAGLLADAGKKLPLVDKIVVNIQVESQPAWLSFEKGKTDYFGIPKDQFDAVVNPDQGISDAYAKKGIILEITPDLDITYMAFNHEDPLFKNNVKLRQAMSMAYNENESNTLFYNDRGIIAQTILPPGIGGYDPNYRNPYKEYNIAKAKKLLAEAGYPEAKGLPVIEYDTVANTVSRQMSEYFKKQMEQIGIKVQINSHTWPQLTKKVKTKQSQMFGMAWVGDYPDAENFLQLLYGPNSSPGPNGGNYNNPEFNKLFDVATKMQPSPKRDELYKKLAQMAAEDVAYIYGVHRTSFLVKHSWLKNYKFSTFSHGNEKYLNIDLKQKQEMLKKL